MNKIVAKSLSTLAISALLLSASPVLAAPSALDGASMSAYQLSLNIDIDLNWLNELDDEIKELEKEEAKATTPAEKERVKKEKVKKEKERDEVKKGKKRGNSGHNKGNNGNDKNKGKGNGNK
jgi:hypothetical protein